MKKYIFTIGLSLATLFLTAQDIVTFTWKGGVNKDFAITFPSGKQFTVNWGDGSVETLPGYGYNVGYIHSYSDTNNYKVSITANNSTDRFTFFGISNVTNLDVSGSTALQYLYCYGNLSNLDLSKNTALIYMDCNNNSLLTSLDLSKNTALRTLTCSNNSLLTSLDLSKNTALQTLTCSNNNSLSNLDLSKNTAMLDLRCSNNQLTTLDLSKNTALRYVYCSYNQLSSLDLSNNKALDYLNCSGNQLTNLDLSYNTALQNLYCSNNQLTNLDLNNNTLLRRLECQENQLNSLNLRKNTALEYLDCSHNQLDSFAIGSNLTTLFCTDNRLPLSELYKAYERTFPQYDKKFGYQFLVARQIVVGDTVDFSSEVQFKGTNTVFKVEKDSAGGASAIVGIDYSINNGFIVFYNANTYVVTMTNGAIKSYLGFPPKVFAEFNVRDKNTDANLASLTVSKGKLTPVFHTDTLNYFVEVGYSVTDISISATARDTNAIVSGHLGLQPLDTGNNVFIINVIAEDNITMQNYYVIVNRKDTIIENNIVALNQENIRVYPNPTTGQLRITNYGSTTLTDHNRTLSGAEVEIYDIYGRNLTPLIPHSSPLTSIDISHLANGMYFLKVGGKVVKIVKE